MSFVNGDLSATSRVESGYAPLSTAPAFDDSVKGIDSVDVTARGSSMVAGEPELQSPRKTETTVNTGRGNTVRVTLVEPQIDKKRLTSWCWQIVRFSASINDKNTLCLVKQHNEKTYNPLIKCTPSDGFKKGTGTPGLAIAHPAMVKKGNDGIDTSEEGKTPIRAAIAGGSSAASSVRASSSSSFVKYMALRTRARCYCCRAGTS